MMMVWGAGLPTVTYSCWRSTWWRTDEELQSDDQATIQPLADARNAGPNDESGPRGDGDRWLPVWAKPMG